MNVNQIVDGIVDYKNINFLKSFGFSFIGQIYVFEFLRIFQNQASGDETHDFAQ